jgi:hypothetical protein
MARTFASWLVFPVIITGAVGGAIALMPAYGPATAVVLAQTGSMLAIIVLEHLLPHRQDWNRSHGDLRVDAIHAVVTGLTTTQLARPFVQLVAAGVAAWLAGLVGFALWPTAWSLWRSSRWGSSSSSSRSTGSTAGSTSTRRSGASMPCTTPRRGSIG